MPEDCISNVDGPSFRLRELAEVSSTNDVVKRALEAGEPEGLAVRACRQTGGYGRQGRTWASPEGGLYLSLLLRPRVPSAQLPTLSLVTGLAVREAVAAVADGSAAESVLIKWPNDVVALPDDPAAVPAVPGWAGTRKIAGVLSELVMPEAAAGGVARVLVPGTVPADRDEASMVILGVGVNIGQAAEELPVPWAGSLRTLGAVGTGSGPDPEDAVEIVLTAIGHHLARLVGQWEEVGGNVDASGGALGRRLREALTTLGKQVSVQAPDGELGGLAVDVTPALVLRTQAGDTEVRAGDVTLVRMEG